MPSRKLCKGKGVKGLSQMPYQILCDSTWQKSLEARSGVSLAPSRCTSLHKFGMASYQNQSCFPRR